MTSGGHQEPGRPLQPRYLEAEATHITFQAVPGSVFVYLERHMPDEAAIGRQVRHTFTELTIPETFILHRMLGAALVKAAALAALQPSHIEPCSLV